MIDQDENRKVVGGMRTMSADQLDAGEVTIRVRYSSINYKDALAATGAGKIIRRFPCVGGIDLCGEVVDSVDARFRPGDKVIATSFDIGVAHHGGYAEYARVPAGWVVPLPAGLTTKEAMALGTAGFTAALSIHQMERCGLATANGPVLVTGATGGVGSTALSMLAGLGYTVAGSTGKDSEHQFLRDLGATEVLSREEVSAESPRPLESERWAGAVDPVGGATTAYLIRSMKYGGSIALSGLTGGTVVGTTVLPFILRGVNLLGIDSVFCPMPLRLAIWKRMAGDLKPRGLLETIAQETTLEGVADATAQILQGRIRGRVLVNLA
ncbi:MAG: acryloyl-CoA reductase [Dehalococcoidia bacterium]|nr:acryloyl-CoA reductase [Dehalococcoidia bacterium]